MGPELWREARARGGDEAGWWPFLRSIPQAFFRESGSRLG